MSEADVTELTEELRAVRESLDLVLNRLDALDQQARTERTRAWWHRGVSLALILLFALLSFVAWLQWNQRAANCNAITDAFDTYTEALAAFSTAGSDRGPEAQDRFDERVEVFRAEVATRLAACR